MLMDRWVQEICLKHMKRNKMLLVMDSFSAHYTEEIVCLLAKSNSKHAIIPGGCMSKLQPLDVSLNKPFKSNAVKSSQPTAIHSSPLWPPLLITSRKQTVCDWIKKGLDYLEAN